MAAAKAAVEAVETAIDTGSSAFLSQADLSSFQISGASAEDTSAAVAPTEDTSDAGRPPEHGPCSPAAAVVTALLLLAM